MLYCSISSLYIFRYKVLYGRVHILNPNTASPPSRAVGIQRTSGQVVMQIQSAILHF